MQNYHITKKNGQWELKPQGGVALRTFNTKAEAVAAAPRIISQMGGGSLKIHREDGTFEEERTYPRSTDPRTSKG